MKIIKDITEDEMISIFLKAKMESPRHVKEMQQILKTFNADRKIINIPNFSNQNENELRKELVHSFGGSDDEGNLFDNFPKNVSWKRALLTKDDLMKIKYINYSYWNELSNGTRLVSSGALSIRKGVEIFKQSNQPFWDALDALKKGARFHESILIAKNSTADFVIVDGHLRLTVYLLDKQYTPNEVQVILGFSEDFQNWDLY